MSVLLLLIPVSLAMATTFVTLCVLSIRNGQFDDLESPRWRVLFDGTVQTETAAGTIARKGINKEELG
jgi:cbb3-type cytochrome oxidase maturation protein